MGIKRTDLAQFRPVCIDCRGVGRVLNQEVETCGNCKGRGWVLEDNARQTRGRQAYVPPDPD